MAWSYIGEIHDSEYSITTQPAANATRSFRVQASVATDTLEASTATAGIPIRGEPYPGNPRLTVQRVVSRREHPDSYQLAIVSCEYGTISGSLNPLAGGDDDNPINRPAIESWGFTTVQEVATRGRLGDADTGMLGDDLVAVTNSAGMDFRDPPLKTIYMPTLTFRRNEPAFDYAIAAAYVGKVNSEVWFGAAVHAVLCVGISADRRQNESGYGTYWEVAYEFVFNPNKWYNWIADRGLYSLGSYLDGTRWLRRMPDVDGNDTSEPLPLDGHGQPKPMALGEPVESQLIFRKYLLFDEVDFDALGLTG